MISFDEAIHLISSAAKPLGMETVPLARAAGLVLAQPVVAKIDSPRRDTSAMDGYAVDAEDLKAFPARLTILGESFPGAPWSGVVERGTCVRVFTGAPVPRGANQVVMQEDVRRQDDCAFLDFDPGPTRYIRERASDFAAGEEILPTGTVLHPRAIVAAAGADIDKVAVFRRPRLHIFSTGDELAEPGTARDTADAIPESVSFGVAALAQQWGAIGADTTRLKDEVASMQAAAEQAIDSADLIVVTGGASVGEKDFAKAMFAAHGLHFLFSNVAIRPGKPAWLGLVGDRFIVGLPGNPTSALVTARLFLAPLLALIGGRSIESALAWRSARLRAAVPAAGAREIFHRAAIRDGSVEVLKFQDSSAQKALAYADVLVRQAARSSALSVGDIVPILDF